MMLRILPFLMIKSAAKRGIHYARPFTLWFCSAERSKCRAGPDLRKRKVGKGHTRNVELARDQEYSPRSGWKLHQKGALELKPVVGERSSSTILSAKLCLMER